MTNNQKIQELEGGNVLWKVINKHLTPETQEFIRMWFESALQEKDAEKEKALKDQEDNFLNQKANQHDQTIRKKALTEYKEELAETIQKKLTSSVDFLETEGVPYTEGFETALAEVLSLINSQ